MEGNIFTTVLLLIIQAIQKTMCKCVMLCANCHGEDEDRRTRSTGVVQTPYKREAAGSSPAESTYRGTLVRFQPGPHRNRTANY